MSLVQLSYKELAFGEPKSYEEVVTSKQSLNWQVAMEEEMRSLMKNKTWVLVPKPTRKSCVGCKWIFTIKEGNSEKEPFRFKAGLVAKDFTQKEGVDYNKIFLLL